MIQVMKDNDEYPLGTVRVYDSQMNLIREYDCASLAYSQSRVKIRRHYYCERTDRSWVNATIAIYADPSNMIFMEWEGRDLLWIFDAYKPALATPGFEIDSIEDDWIRGALEIMIKREIDA